MHVIIKLTWDLRYGKESATRKRMMSGKKKNCWFVCIMWQKTLLIDSILPSQFTLMCSSGRKEHLHSCLEACLDLGATYYTSVASTFRLQYNSQYPPHPQNHKKQKKRRKRKHAHRGTKQKEEEKRKKSKEKMCVHLSKRIIRSKMKVEKGSKEWWISPLEVAT